MESQAKLILRQELYDLVSEKSDGNENITFIFGAGASYGYTSNPHISYLPPVVSALFDERNLTVREVINQPKHQFILGQKDYLEETLQSNFNGDLEKYLSFLYNRNDQDDTFSDLLIYLQDLCWLASRDIDTGQNNYKKLILRMCTLRGTLPWSLVTFNYDTILEKSFIAAGRDRTRHFNTNADYFEGNPKIVKIHGGVNFRYLLQELKSVPKRSERSVFTTMMREKKMTGSGSSVTPIDQEVPEFYKELDRWNKEDSKYERVHAYNYPLMMIPIHNTQRSEHPFFDMALEEVKREVDASSLIIAVGYNFGDELLFEKLKDVDLTGKDLVLVGTRSLSENPDSHVGYQNAVNNWVGANIRIFEGDGFGDFVQSVSTRSTGS